MKESAGCYTIIHSRLANQAKFSIKVLDANRCLDHATLSQCDMRLAVFVFLWYLTRIVDQQVLYAP